MKILKEIIEKDLFCVMEEVDSWESAIKENAQPLIEKEYIDERYIDEVIKCIKEHGPYIIFVPNVAMPHSTQNAAGVLKTGVSFMKVNKPVKFDENDREKDAQLFFMVASENSQKHLQNIQNLCEIFENEKLLETLSQVTTKEQLVDLIK